MTLIVPATATVSEETNNQSDDQTTLQYVTLVWLRNQRHELPRSISALSQNIP